MTTATSWSLESYLRKRRFGARMDQASCIQSPCANRTMISPVSATALSWAVSNSVDCEPSDIATIECASRKFSIRPATSEKWSSFASQLLNKMYAWRGYGSGYRIDERSDRMAFVASDQSTGEVVGTVTVGLDRENGLQADKLYRSETQDLRDVGYSLCEFTRLAVDHSVKSKLLLGALFHVAFLYAHYVRKCDFLVIEVNPSHQCFYEKLLHFERCGDEILNPRVNAPSVLMCKNLAHSAELAKKYGGQGARARERSLYAYFLPPHEASLARSALLSMAAPGQRAPMDLLDLELDPVGA